MAVMRVRLAHLMTVVVLAANGLGTPRLLLMSTSPAFPDGLANGSGLVGRNLMVHMQTVVVGRFPMGGVGAPTVYGDRGGMVKIVGETRYGELLGAHIVGARATDLIAELVVAKQLEGGREEVARAVHAHPTFSEAVMEAARAADGWLIHG